LIVAAQPDNMTIMKITKSFFTFSLRIQNG